MILGSLKIQKVLVAPSPFGPKETQRAEPERTCTITATTGTEVEFSAGCNYTRHPLPRKPDAPHFWKNVPAKKRGRH